MKKIIIICLVSLICLVGLIVIQTPSPALSSPMGFTNTPEPTETPTPDPTATPAPAPASQPQRKPDLPKTGMGAAAAAGGVPLAQLSIPALGLNAPVKAAAWDGQDWNIAGLGEQVGWLDNTASLEQEGNTVLVGHLDLAGGAQGPFSRLDQAPIGATVAVLSFGEKYIYQIDQRYQLAAYQTWVLNPSQTPRLTLITCMRGTWMDSLHTYTHRVVVTARLVRIEDAHPRRGMRAN